MKSKIYSIIFAIASLMFTGCTDVMNKTNLGQLLADDIWEDPYLVRGYRDQIISDALPDGKRVTMGATEEMYGRYGEMEFILNSYNINQEVGGWSYGTIRNINKFLENVDRCPSDRLSDELKAQYKAQMLTMRGWRYFNMVRMYGGVPLVLHELSVDEDLYLPRAKTSECIAQIVKDFDDAIAIESFPMRWENETEAGCISKALTYALKARVLLYYASPQFSKTIGAGTKSAAQRWQEAYEACKTAKDVLAEAGYGLFKPNPVDFDDAVRTFYELYYTEAPENREVIGVKRYYYPNFVSDGYDNLMRPGPSGGSGSDCALEFVNAFLNADGSPFTALNIPASSEIGVSLKQSTVPYWIGREPRFYASIAYNACIWPLYCRNSNTFSEDLDGDGKMRHYWAIEGFVQDPFVNISGLSQTGAVKTRKMIDVDANYAVDGNRCGMDWILCRYAEVLLNFAETALKTGHEDEAIAVMQSIRRRAGIPQGNNNYGLGNATGDELLALIIKERLLELSYESDGFRCFDLRRWRLYTEDIAGYTAKNMVRHTIRPRLKVEGSFNRQAMANLDIMNDPDSYFDVFEDHIYSLDSEPFNVAERQYFFFISFDEHIRRNPNIEQTMGWENGTFDPYE